MATQTWTGNAAAVAQVSTLTPASVSANNTFTVTCNGKSVSYTTAVGTIADVCNGLAMALAQSTQPEFKEFTASNAATSIVLLGNTPGLPFTVSTSASGSGTPTLTAATTTAATGPNNWADVNNWSTGSVPADGDDVFVSSGSVSILYGLAQSGVTLNSLNIAQTFTGQIGLPVTNPKGYYEYRTPELQISATIVNVGQGTGNGSGRIKLNLGSTASTLNVYNTGQPAEQGVPSLLWAGTAASNIVNINKGSVGLAYWPWQSATIATLRIGYVSNQQSDSQVTAGTLCTVTTVTKNGGVLTMNAGAATINNNAGNLTINGTGGVTTLTVNGNSVVYNSSGTLGTAIVTGQGTLDFSQDQQSKTVTNPVQIYGDSAQLIDPFQVVGSLVIDLEQNADLSNLDIGSNISLTRGTAG